MHPAELAARAIQRATDRVGVYTTCSRSEPGTRHTLVARDGVTACSCRGYEYRQSCKHVEGLRARLAREAKRAGLLVIAHKEVS